MNQRGNQPPSKNQAPLSEEVVGQFLKTQHQNALNEAEEIRLRSREVDLQAKYAEKALELQAKLLTSKPGENRKTITTFAIIAIVIMAIFLGFLVWCLHLGKEDFAFKFLQGIGYVFTTCFGYWLGRKTNKGPGNNNNGIQDAEVVN